MATVHRPIFGRMSGAWLGAAALLGLALLLALGFALGEASGWPFLIAPLQGALSQRLGRSVQLVPVNAPVAPSVAQPASRPDTKAAAAPGAARLHFWGGLELQTPWLEVAAPAWSQAPYMLLARDVELHLRYADLWRAWQGQQLLVQSLRAASLDAILERRADGQASWQLQAPGKGIAPPVPEVQALDVPEAQLRYSDAPRGLALQAQAVVKDLRLALQLTASGGGAHLAFEGNAEDLRHWQRLQGHFSLQGPSLAAVGTQLGITLPTTGAFSVRGQLRHQEQLWDVVLESAQVGTSQLAGHFVFDTGKPVPLLSGTLAGARLHLLDLGPALGAEPRPRAGRTKILPARPFDLASLRAMDAEVGIALAELDLNTSRLEPLRPFRAQLLLSQGVLTLKDLDARTGQGHLSGTVSLNGQQDRAHWVASLQWDGVALQQWIHQTRGAGQPPYVSGQLQGQARLQGDGRSTAEILATLQGRIFSTVQGGTISHLLMEAASLHVVETVGAYLQGDRAWPLDCAVADLRVEHGTLTPSVLVLDTRDATLWLDGSLSLAQETLDLRAVVAPKDFSPLSLRSPLHVGGTFAAPQVTVEKGPLGRRLGSALLLGLINPLAAWIPLVDVGSRVASQKEAQACRAHLQQKVQQKMQKTLPQPGRAGTQ
jgi:uncharacterized protein involved in outer membrane biogenesis